MSSHSALHLCEVWYQSDRMDTNDGSADERMDRHSKFRLVYHNTLATFCGGAKKETVNHKIQKSEIIQKTFIHGTH